MSTAEPATRSRTLEWSDPVATAAAGAEMSGLDYLRAVIAGELGCAVHTTLPAGVGYTSLGLEVKYLRPISRDTGRVLCEGTVVHRGRRQATAEARLTAEDTGKLLATGTSTLMIFGG